MSCSPFLSVVVFPSFHDPLQTVLLHDTSYGAELKCFAFSRQCLSSKLQFGLYIL